MPCIWQPPHQLEDLHYTHDYTVQTYHTYCYTIQLKLSTHIYNLVDMTCHMLKLNASKTS